MKLLITAATLLILSTISASAQIEYCPDGLGKIRMGRLTDGRFTWFYDMQRLECSNTWSVYQVCPSCNNGRGRNELSNFNIERIGNDVIISTETCTINAKFAEAALHTIIGDHSCGCCGGTFESLHQVPVLYRRPD